MSIQRKVFLIPFTIITVFILDFLSKSWVINLLQDQPHLEVTSFFNLVLAFNRGVSFSMFQAGSTYGVMMLITLTSLLSFLIIYLAWKSTFRAETIGYAMIAGGALGNLYDRVRLGAVVDFLDVHAFGYHWPAFNIADSSICIGAGLLFLYQFLLHSKYKNTKNKHA